jgi:hypothetical protein
MSWVLYIDPRIFGSRDNRKVVENAVKDFSPDTKDNVIKSLNSWEGKKSASKLREILGQNKSEELLKSIAKEDVNLRGMFMESLTFD